MTGVGAWHAWIQVAFWKFGIVNNFFQWFMMDQLAPIFIIGRAIVTNARNQTTVDSIEQMAAVRAEAGLQWVLFTQTIMAARVMMNTVRVLQRMGAPGPAVHSCPFSCFSLVSRR